MLLTSSQVSAALSSGIVALFTSILFASGYFLQQQSVRNLNAALHPGGGRKGPWEQLVARAELALATQDAANFRDQDEQEGRDGFVMEGLEGAVDGPGVDGEEKRRKEAWARRAYVSVVRRPEDVCNAVMAVTSLSIQGSPARRVMVYPGSWLDEETQEFKSAPETELIQIAKQEHLLETIAWESVAGNQTEEATGSDWELGGFLTGLRDFEELLFLRPEGLILNASRLDTLFDVDTLSATVAAINRGNEPVAPAMIVRPRGDAERRSEISLQNGKGGGNDEPFPSIVETTASLQRSSGDFRSPFIAQENRLMKMGYVAWSKMLDLDSNLEDEGSGVENSELKKRSGGATIPLSLGNKELVDEFTREYERHKEMVCGAMLSIIRPEGSENWVDT